LPADFPFAGATDLTAIIKRMPSSDNRWRFLVLSLLHCTAKFPFDKLTYGRDNDNRKPEDPESDNPDELKRPAFPTPKSHAQADIVVQSQEEAFAALDMVFLPLPEERFSDLRNKPCQKVYKEECFYISAKKCSDTRRTIEQLSTGEGGFSPNTTAPADVVVTRGKRQGLPPGLEPFAELVAYLDSLQGISASLREPTSDISVNLSFVPLDPLKTRQWGFLNHRTKLRMPVAIADIYFADNTCCCLIEIGRNHDAPNESYNMGLAFKKNNALPEEYELYDLLLCLAKANGRWGNISYDGELSISTIRHSVLRENIASLMVTKMNSSSMWT